jgi:hypothetical protein
MGIETDSAITFSTNDLGNQPLAELAESGAFSGENHPCVNLDNPDTDLVRIIEAWPTLAASVRAAMLAMLEPDFQKGHRQ